MNTDKNDLSLQVGLNVMKCWELIGLGKHFIIETKKHFHVASLLPCWRAKTIHFLSSGK